MASFRTASIPLKLLSSLAALKGVLSGNCGPALCDESCSMNATFIDWREGIHFNASVQEGDVLAVLVSISDGAPVTVSSPCTGNVVLLHNFSKNEVVRYQQELAVVEPPGVAAPTQPPPPEACKLPILTTGSGDVVARVASPCTFTGFASGVAQGSNVRTGALIATCLQTGSEAQVRDVQLEVESPATGNIAALQTVAYGCHVHPEDDLAVITVGLWDQNNATAAALPWAGESTTAAATTSTVMRETAIVEAITAATTIAATTTSSTKQLLALGVGSGDHIEVCPADATFASFLCKVGDKVDVGTPLVELKQASDGAVGAVKASVSGQVVAIQSELRPGDDVPVGTDLVALRLASGVPAGEAQNWPEITSTAAPFAGEGAAPEPGNVRSAPTVENGNYAPDGWNSAFGTSAPITESAGASTFQGEVRCVVDGTFAGFQAQVGHDAQTGDTMALIKTSNGLVRIRAPLAGTISTIGNHWVGSEVKKGDVLLTLLPDTMQASYPAPAQGGLSTARNGIVQLVVAPLLIIPLVLCCGLLAILPRRAKQKSSGNAPVYGDKAEVEQLLFSGKEADSHLPSEDLEAGRDGDEAAKVREIVDAGFTEVQARQALADAGGDLDGALEALIASGSETENEQKVHEIVDAGFTEGQAREALKEAHGNLDDALEALLTGGSTASTAVSATAVQDLCEAAGCTEEQAKRALRQENGDREKALLLLIEGSRSGSETSKTSSIASGKKVAALVAEGFPPEAAKGALVHCNGDVGAAQRLLSSQRAAQQAAAPVRPPAPAPPAPTSEESKVAQLVDAGFRPDRARQALRDCGGNTEDAMLALLANQSESSKASKASKLSAKLASITGSEDDKVAQLVEAGFSADAARKALRQAKGDIEDALMALISDD
mmetsp:Transcript_20853/g.48336  ORF Transcript_20853/g.48336 Transcript_20853/m.48336 type:complete len:894 (-) Transcript_20853:14-2695(-)